MTSLPSIAVGEEYTLDLRWFDTEAARSRRNGRPLTALVLLSTSSASKSKSILRRRAQPNAALLELVQHEVRRSDYVLSSTDEAVVVIAPESDDHEIALLAQRVNDLDVDADVAWGTAVFPTDGLTLTELIDTATSRVTAASARPRERA